MFDVEVFKRLYFGPCKVNQCAILRAVDGEWPRCLIRCLEDLSTPSYQCDLRSSGGMEILSRTCVGRLVRHPPILGHRCCSFGQFRGANGGSDDVRWARAGLSLRTLGL